jgi:manganese/iron transport system permease protein/iron/zinc/copper transport system permease protein
VIGLLTDPFAYAFFGRAMIAGVLVGALCGALSVPIVLKRMSYVGHGLAHSVLGGVAVGVALGADLYIGAVVATVLSAVLIDRVAARRGLHHDAAIGIVTTAAFALGIAVLAIVPTRLNLEAVLFGNILGVDGRDLVVTAGVALVATAVLFVTYKRLVLVVFDPEVAAVHGVRVRRIELLLNLLTAAVVVASVRVLGALLIAAAVVLPAAGARLVTRSFAGLVATAIALGTAASVLGLYTSYHLDVPSGPAIVLVGTLGFLVAYVGSGTSARRALRGGDAVQAEVAAT